MTGGHMERLWIQQLVWWEMVMMNDDGVIERFDILIMDAHWAVSHFTTSAAL